MKHIILLATALLMSVAPFGYADTGYVTAKVNRTLVTADGLWGGCMVRLDTIPTLANCQSGYVTFSCSGIFTTKDVAYRMFDSAVMAKALDRPVLIQVDNSKKHNGACFVTRIDVL